MSLLNCGSFMAPEQIPRELFHSNRLKEPAFTQDDAGLAVDAIVRKALTFSILTGDGDALNMHRLTQRAIRVRLGTERANWLTLAQDLVGDRFPDGTAGHVTWPDCQRLLPHAASVTARAEGARRKRFHCSTALVCRTLSRRSCSIR